MANASILIVDDDYDSMAPLQNSLITLCGYQVTLSAESKLATELAHVRFDIICLDLMIKESSPMLTKAGQRITMQNIHFDSVNWRETGLEFLHQLRMGAFSNNGNGTSPMVPVIVISATADQNILDAVDEIGKASPTWYMEKPFLLPTVLEKINLALTGA